MKVAEKLPKCLFAFFTCLVFLGKLSGQHHLEHRVLNKLPKKIELSLTTTTLRPEHFESTADKYVDPVIIEE